MKILIFSGYNPRALISFCRVATEYHLDFDIIAKSKTDEIFNTAYAKNVTLTRKSSGLDIGVILDIIKIYNNRPIFILPSTEYLNRILISNSETLKKNNVHFGLTDKKTYELVSDKITFGNLCKIGGISIPTEYDEIQIPCVLKPKQYFNSSLGIDSPKLIFDKSDVSGVSNLEDFYIQQYVEGESVYLLYYISKSGEYSVYSQKNYIQQANGGSILLAKSTNDYESVFSKKVANLLIDVGFSGLIMVEFRKTPNDWVMIEANPRLWGPSQLILDSGMDLFDMFLYDNTLTNYKIERSYKSGITYLWYLGMSPTDVKLDKIQPRIDLIDDLYNRSDTNKLLKMEQLKKLYNTTSKHSHYQQLPKSISDLIGESTQEINRYELERIDYINSNIDLTGKTILDVGANTGFFSISSLDNGATSVDVFEGNQSHADFITNVSDILELDINVNRSYLQFNETFDKKYDVVYFLNVVHHLGDDFGDVQINVDNAKQKMSEILKYFSDKTKFMVFQMGYCWKGNRDLLLFENGTKQEMISFVENSIDGHWDIVNVGILEEDLRYHNLDDANIVNKHNLREFGNRPLFILKSKITS